MSSDTQNGQATTERSSSKTPLKDPLSSVREDALNLTLERPPDRVPTQQETSPRRRWLWRLFLASVFVIFLSSLAIVGIFYFYGRDLPGFDKLNDYDPPQVTKVFDQKGIQIAEFFHERRTLIPIEEIPQVMREAIVSAEDGSFYEHNGLDYLGILRALLIDLKELRLVQGASTITQQVIKNMVLSPERKFERKIKEAILAQRLEQNLSKDELLSLYLNHIYFGHGRYGIGEAARFYFDKTPMELSLGEAAMLAGLPQSPNRLSPLRNPERTKKRQRYVLDQMARNGFITREEAEHEMVRPIPVVGREVVPVGKYYVETVRRKLLSRYGQKALYEGGLRVEVAMDSKIQKLAEEAVAQGLEALERKNGLGRPLAHLDVERWSALREAFVAATAPTKSVHILPVGEPIALVRSEYSKTSAARSDRILVSTEDAEPEERDEIADPLMGWDFSKLPIVLLQSISERQLTDDEDGKEATVEDVDVGQVVAKLLRVPLVPGATLTAPLKSMDARALHIDLGNAVGRIDRSTIGWAKLGKDSTLPSGALYRVRVRQAHPALPKKAAPLTEAESSELPLELIPMPTVQAALVAMDPRNRSVLALDGGYDFALSQFNRATQARRQPGSSFKPIVYGAAFESGRFTPASILNDAPDVHRDPWTGKEWRPQNYERDVYEGPMGLREALSKSKNTISVRIIEAVGPEAVIDFARRMGITSPLPSNLTLGLGTGEVTPFELVNAYATLAAQGQRAEPALLLSVRDRHGELLEQSNPLSEEVISPAVAFLVTSLMQSVIEDGTGRRARELGRPVAGKTGTASQNRDAWFAGFTPELVAVVWVGRDNHEPIGRGGTGGGVALPIWVDFMKGALEGVPVTAFEPPEDVEAVRINPSSGKRIGLPVDGTGDMNDHLALEEELPGRIEYFVSGTAPEEEATPEGEADPRFFLLEESGIGR